MSPEVALLVGLLLLLANAFFVGAEFSLVSVRRSAIEPRAAKGSKRAITTLGALENVSYLMAGAQLGITLCSLGLGAVAEPAFAYLLEGPFEAIHIPHELIHPISFIIALTVTVFLHVVIGEMVPKNIALAKPERSALILTPWLVFVVRVLNPIVHFLNALANLTLRLFKIRPANEVASTYTRDEMAELVKESRQEGMLTEDNENLLSGALTFDAQTVKDIAVPIKDYIAANKSTTYEGIEKLATATGFSRFPVLGKQQEVLGYVHIKDIIKVEDSKRTVSIKDRDIRKLVKVSSGQSIRMTLKVMQRSGAHMALVSKGSQLLGIVTLEDVLEELIGESSIS